MNETPPTPVAGALSARAPSRRHTPPSAATRPAAPVRPISPVRPPEGIEVPAHMASMVGARVKPGLNGVPGQGIGGTAPIQEAREHNPLFDGPAPRLTAFRGKLTQLRSLLGAFLAAADNTDKLALEVLTESSGDAELIALMSLEGMDREKLGALRDQFVNLIDQVKPKKAVAAPPAAAAEPAPEAPPTA